MAKSKDANDDLLSQETGLIPYDGDADSLIEPAMETADFRTLLDAGYECEKFISIPDGGRIAGYFLGAGPDTEVNNPNYNPRDPEDAPKRKMGTWRVRHDAGVVLTFLSNSQLGTKLGKVPVGEHVIVQRMGETQLGGGRRVANFEVFHNPKKRIKVEVQDWSAPNGAPSPLPAA